VRAGGERRKGGESEKNGKNREIQAETGKNRKERAYIRKKPVNNGKNE